MGTDKVVYDVDLASDVKLLATTNADVTFVDDGVKKKLFDIKDNNSLLRVGKSIGSLKIISIDVMDTSFLKKVFTGK